MPTGATGANFNVQFKVKAEAVVRRCSSNRFS